MSDKELASAEDIACRIEDVLEDNMNPNLHYRDYPSRIVRHMKRTTVISLYLADIIDLPLERTELLMIAARFHDYGKRIWPNTMIFRPREQLSDYESGLKKNHAVHSSVLLRNDLKALDQEVLRIIDENYPEVFKIIKYHHKDYNGNGCPEGEPATNAPPEAHILRVVDSYDAMRSPRLYRDPKNQMMEHERALYQIVINEGEEFHPDMVEAFKLILKAKLDFLYQHVTAIENKAAN